MAAYSPRGALPLSTEACLLRPLPVLQGAGAAGLRAWGKAPACRASESPAESSMGAGAQRAIRALLVLGGTVPGLRLSQPRTRQPCHHPSLSGRRGRS